MTQAALNRKFLAALNGEIASLPTHFFSTFQYTKTGKNLTHPVTMGAIARVVGQFPWVAFVEIDVRLNDNRGAEFQPDVVGFDDIQTGRRKD